MPSALRVGWAGSEELALSLLSSLSALFLWVDGRYQIFSFCTPVTETRTPHLWDSMENQTGLCFPLLSRRSLGVLYQMRDHSRKKLSEQRCLSVLFLTISLHHFLLGKLPCTYVLLFTSLAQTYSFPACLSLHFWRSSRHVALLNK